MSIKRISGLLLLCFSFMLTGCIESISDEEETIYGTFSTSQLEQETADELIQKTIDFNEESYGKVTFEEGYSILNKGTGGSLYLGVYKQPGAKPLDFEGWADAMQESNIKHGWIHAKKGSYGETIFDASETFSENNQERILVAVKVDYNLEEDTYWVYLAIPRNMIEAVNSEQVKKLFADQRRDKNKK